MSWYFDAPGIRFNDYLFTDPAPFLNFRPPGCAGIAVVMVRNSQWSPKPLQPLFFTEFGNNAGGGALARLPGETGSCDLYVSVLAMPYSTASQRRTACKELIAAYNPAWQANGIAISTAELARKLEELEARQQEQSQQILSLLTYISKLFEPQPVSPRRPIGFLAPMWPATESES
ncbi:MAG TPA: hypothetical protein VMB03_01290 [Bryobacteraceae bacterium]|nr:hypothetical protein [Bryobacteraceae bacterium]